MNRQISAVMVWRSGVTGTSNAVRKYCANTIAFDALNLFRVTKLYTRPEVQVHERHENRANCKCCWYQEFGLRIELLKKDDFTPRAFRK